MFRFIKNIFLILLPFYLNCVFFNCFFKIPQIFLVDPLLIISHLSSLIYSNFNIENHLYIYILTMVILLFPSYFALFLSLRMRKNKQK